VLFCEAYWVFEKSNVESSMQRIEELGLLKPHWEVKGKLNVVQTLKGGEF